MRGTFNGNILLLSRAVDISRQHFAVQGTEVRVQGTFHFDWSLSRAGDISKKILTATSVIKSCQNGGTFSKLINFLETNA